MKRFVFSAAAFLASGGAAVAADYTFTGGAGQSYTSPIDLNVLTNGSSVDIAPGTQINAPEVGLQGRLRPWTIQNAGAIFAGSLSGGGGTPGVYLQAGGSVTNVAGASIDGGGSGIYIAGAGGTVINAGFIRGRGHDGAAIDTNPGVELTRGGSVTNTGEIEGSEVGVVTGGIGDINNRGRIVGLTHHGVQMEGGGVLTNQRLGVITGGLHGVVIGDAFASTGPDGNVSNEGTIRGENTGLYSQYGGTVANYGTITGRFGIVMHEAGTVTNAGEITGSSGDAILFDHASDPAVAGPPNLTARPILSTTQSSVHTLILQTGSVINGNVHGGYENNQLILEGTGSEDSHFTAFSDLTMRGSRWTLSSTTTQVSRIVIESGALFYSGRVTSAVNVGAGRTLGGRGTFPSVVNAGTIAPGESIGTLTVTGDYTHNASATYEVEVSAAGQSDLIAVGGRATLEGGSVLVIPAAGEYSAVNTYTILTAAGGVSGQFSSVRSSLPFLTPVLTYQANGVELVLLNNGSIGNIYASARTMTGYVMRQQAGRIGSRFLESRVGQGEMQVWADGGLGWTRANDGSNAAAKANSADILAGAGYGLGEALEVGAFTGVGKSGVDALVGDDKADSTFFTVGAYTALSVGSVKAAAAYATGWDDISATRVMAGSTANGELSGRRDFLMAQLSWGGRISNIEISPYASYVHGNVRHDAVAETGGGNFNAILPAAKSTTSVTRLGVRLAGEVGAEGNAFQPYANVAWAYEHGDVTALQNVSFAAAPASTFPLQGVTLPKNTGELEVGASRAWDKYKVQFGYRGAYGSNFTNHGVHASFALVW